MDALSTQWDITEDHCYVTVCYIRIQSSLRANRSYHTFIPPGLTAIAQLPPLVQPFTLPSLSPSVPSDAEGQWPITTIARQGSGKVSPSQAVLFFSWVAIYLFTIAVSTNNKLSLGKRDGCVAGRRDQSVELFIRCIYQWLLKWPQHENQRLFSQDWLTGHWTSYKDHLFGD